MQQLINDVFKNIFDIMTGMLGRFVEDPGTRWGLAIILFTVLFNLLVLPLNWKSIVNSKKMSMIQPELKRLQEKYKNDPQTFAAEQQKLMKENNVSMLGGCLPMLIQWPLFIAMFAVFRELSAPGGVIVGKAFTPLIPDLAAPKNIPLTVLVVIATVFQQWAMAQGYKNKSPEVRAQQSQMQSMNVVMAVMMAWFTYSQPAALGLYWVAGTIFRAVQQLVMNKVEEKNSVGDEDLRLEAVRETGVKTESTPSTGTKTKTKTRRRKR